METTAAVPDEKGYALENKNSNVSYSTDAQSVQSGVTHGTPHSPTRTTATPLSLSPASHNNTLKSNHQIPDATVAAMEAIPQYRKQPGDMSLEEMQQMEWQVMDQQHQQNVQRSNPASDDEGTEPSSSGNTREKSSATTKGYTRSDPNTGATSTFGRLVKSAAKVS